MPTDIETLIKTDLLVKNSIYLYFIIITPGIYRIIHENIFHVHYHISGNIIKIKCNSA